MRQEKQNQNSTKSELLLGEISNMISGQERQKLDELGKLSPSLKSTEGSFARDNLTSRHLYNRL